MKIHYRHYRCELFGNNNMQQVYIHNIHQINQDYGIKHTLN